MKKTGSGTGCRISGALLMMVFVAPVVGCDSGRVDPGRGQDKGAGGLDAGPWVLDSHQGVRDLRASEAGPTCDAQQSVCGSVCCSAEELCHKDLCVALGPECAPLAPCAAGYFCDDSLARCVPVAKRCEYRPPAADFAPKVAWEWTGSAVLPTYNQVMMTPAVANLTDDNGDGKADRNDIPDIVFNTFSGGNYTTDGVLRVISGDGSGEHLTISDPALRTQPGTQIALADIDNDGLVEIVACASGGGTLAFKRDGTLKWRAETACYAPALADLDGDGNPEVIVTGGVLAGPSGTLLWATSAGCSPHPIAADLDDDGKSEVICGRVVYRHDGKVMWNDTARPHGAPAIADLDGDGKAEVVVVSSGEHSLRAYHADGTLYWGPVDVNQGHATAGDKCDGCGGGPLTIADFDGDGRPEIAAAAGWGYVIFEHDGSPKWFQPTQDLSSRATGSAVFDFEGDGKAEVVYNDELKLRIYQGEAGTELFSHCNTSGTLQEYPLIVDVNNDDHAEIIVVNNNYAFKQCDDGSPSHTGIRVFADAKSNWVRTRRIWNQHGYHVTNIDEDGRVPRVAKQNWKDPTLNNYRQNVQSTGLFHAPDLLGDAGAVSCDNAFDVAVVVHNEGAAKVVVGTPVSLYAEFGGQTRLLGTELTKTTLYPGQQETLRFQLATPTDLKGKDVALFAVVDDDGTATATSGRHNECDEDNNRVDLGSVKCRTIQ